MGRLRGRPHQETLTGKKVAFFGLGDQKRYPDHFVDGMGLLYDKVKPLGLQIVGTWPKDGYDYQASAGEVDGHLVGLALDEDNESAQTPTSHPSLGPAAQERAARVTCGYKARQPRPLTTGRTD